MDSQQFSRCFVLAFLERPGTVLKSVGSGIVLYSILKAEKLRLGMPAPSGVNLTPFLSLLFSPRIPLIVLFMPGDGYSTRLRQGASRSK